MATARGIFNSNGGVLSSIETGVSIIIPQGAIPEGVEQEIYFKVCRDNSILPPLDKEKGTVSSATTRAVAQPLMVWNGSSKPLGCGPAPVCGSPGTRPLLKEKYSSVKLIQLYFERLPESLHFIHLWLNFDACQGACLVQVAHYC